MRGAMESRASPPRYAFALLFLAVTAFLAATFTFRRITDTELNSFQTRALVLHGDVDLDRYERLDKPSYFKVRRGEGVYSIYGIGVSLTVLPIYAPLAHLGASDEVLQAAGAIPYVAGAIVLMYGLLLRLTRPALAAAGAVVFGFGTTLWPVAAMGLYQQSPVAFFQTLGLIGLFSGSRRAAGLAGLGFGMAAFIRPTTAIPFALVGLYYLTRGKRPTALYALGSLLPMVALVVQNRWLWGEWLTGGYSHSGIGFNADVSEALFGLTLGWWRGIFVYSPVLVLGLAGWIMALRRFRGSVELRVAVLGISSVATILFYSKWTTWWNGLNQFGYRYLLDIVPFLVVLGVYAVTRAARLHTLAVPLAVVSVLTMTVGAGPNRFGYDGVMFASRVEDTSLGQAWIAFLDAPAGGLLKLVGIALIGWLMVRVGSGIRGTPTTFEANPST